ncbi:MAG: relaxase/mobilization nuclease domain-containing protein [Bacteroides sp.]|nr:relaxase/mobilization nuclease domain-containing protein [Bacteroides sp.]MCM1531472.1 relaxase/mobilization nuclease domain-containing protein [Ruminococcus flavefaciens]MCM1554366.1 relaxase/mobilization nuclease domain-containing protein [Bacteroides sp.]
MVIKITKSTKIDAVVGYNMEKVAKGEAVLLDSDRIPVRFNEEGIPYKQEMVDVFDDRRQLNARVRNPVTHISLNPDPKDICTDGLLTKMAHELLDELGYGDQPCVIFKHTDIERHHVHIVVSNIDERGRKIGDSHERYRANRIRKGLEEKYRLHKAEESERQSVAVVEKTQAGKAEVAWQVAGVCSRLLADYRFTGFGEFRTFMEECGVRMNVVDTEAGKGLSYAVSDGDNGQRTPWVPASELGKEFMYDGVTQKVEQSRLEAKAYCRRQGLRKLMEGHLQAKDLQDLNRKAAAVGMSYVFRFTLDGKPYGCTVIDQKRQVVFNASQVHRSLSAQAWQKFFDNRPIPDRLVVGRKIDRESKQDTDVWQKIDTLLDGILPREEKRRYLPQYAPNSPNPASGWTQGGAKAVPKQERANTHFHFEDEEEEEERRRKHRRL